MRRRLWWLITLMLGSLAVLAGRLLLWMLWPDALVRGASWRWQDRSVSRAELEHLRLLQVDDGRGRILFRNGQPWSGRVTSAWLSFAGHPPLRVRLHTERGTGHVDAVVGRVGLPDVWPDPSRAVPEQGRSGLESAFDPWLRGRHAGYIGRLHDAAGAGAGDSRLYAMRPDRGTDLRTTIDPAWQKVAETALAEAGVPCGAVVMLALPNHDVIALANRDTERPAAIPAVMGQVPGSVFKLVTAAAALDTFRYRFDSRFYCSGVVRIPGVHMRCWTAHGRETLATAIAQSCDTVFAEVGIRVGRTGLTEMARRLGLFDTGLAEAGGRPVLSEAEAGVVFRHAGDDAGLLANTAIGQQDVRISPVQAARVAAAVADDGVTRDARLILDVERTGQVLQTFAPAPAHRAFSALTAWQIKRAMRLAVTSPAGTAHALERQHLAVAAKTGTAELDAAGHVNGWMVGFFPYDHPVYAFCVFVGNMPSPAAHRAVVEITRRLTDAYLVFHPATPVTR